MAVQTETQAEILNPPKSEFLKALEIRWRQGIFVCVGLDPDYDLIPEFIKHRTGSVDETIFTFNREIVDAVSAFTCAFKLNSAFYEAHGEPGYRALKQTVAHIKDKHPEIPVILDAKRGDIGHTNIMYARAVFDVLGADAVTAHPYPGKEALRPFLDRTDKGIIILARTSNPGAGEFQDLPVGTSGEPLYLTVAKAVADSWNDRGNCGLVVGASYPGQLSRVRTAVGDMPILVPGVGAQGAELGAAVKAGRDSRNWGLIVNSSRGIIFSSRQPDFAAAAADAAQKLNSQINRNLHD